MADRLRARLLAWYDANKRDLPWRRYRDPYAIWVSETMLQQTTVGVVVPYFERWMKSFPTVASLANADIDAVLAHWQGLGYYRRAKNLHAAAQSIHRQGRFPETFDEWLMLPGVGRYTAGAVCAIAFGHATPAVDGNVLRVYSRLHADGSAGIQGRCETWAGTLVRGSRSGDAVQALMELGATVCLPRSPRCPDCPFSRHCAAKREGKVDSYPVKSVKPETVKLVKHIYVPCCNGRFGVTRIPEGEWSAGLYRFESDRSLKGALLIGQFGHTVTKHRISVKVYVNPVKSKSRRMQWYKSTELENVPMPSDERKAARLAIDHLFQSGKKSIGKTTRPLASKK